MHWSVVNCPGPSPRQASRGCSVGSLFFLHGGNNGPNWYGDMHILNLDTLEWRPSTSLSPRVATAVQDPNDVPKPRAWHTLTDCGDGRRLFLFGGRDEHAWFNDLFFYDIGNTTATAVCVCMCVCVYFISNHHHLSGWIMDTKWMVRDDSEPSCLAFVCSDLCR